MTSLINMGVRSAVLILLILLLRAAFGKLLPKQIFRLLWIVAAVRMVLPFSLPVLPKLGTEIGKAQNMPVRTQSAEIKQSVEVTESAADKPIFTDTPAQETFTVYHAEQPLSVTEDDSATEEYTDMHNIIMCVWAAGVVISFAVILVGHKKTLDRIACSLPCDDGRFKKIADSFGIRRKISISISDEITTPMTCGTFRPRIVLPEGMTEMPESIIRTAMAHELTHIRSFDSAVKWLLAAAACLHWFDPLAWVMLVTANRDIELACDEDVLRRRCCEQKEYALALIGLEERRSGLLGAGFGSSPVKERITTIMNYKELTITGTVISAILLTGSLMVFTSQNKIDETTEKTENIAASAPAESDTEEQTESETAAKVTIPPGQTAKSPKLIWDDEEHAYLQTKDGTYITREELDKMCGDRNAVEEKIRYLDKEDALKILEGSGIDYEIHEPGWCDCVEIGHIYRMDSAVDTPLKVYFNREVKGLPDVTGLNAAEAKAAYEAAGFKVLDISTTLSSWALESDNQDEFDPDADGISRIISEDYIKMPDEIMEDIIGMPGDAYAENVVREAGFHPIRKVGEGAEYDMGCVYKSEYSDGSITYWLSKANNANPWIKLPITVPADLIGEYDFRAVIYDTNKLYTGNPEKVGVSHQTVRNPKKGDMVQLEFEELAPVRVNVYVTSQDHCSTNQVRYAVFDIENGKVTQIGGTADSELLSIEGSAQFAEERAAGVTRNVSDAEFTSVNMPLPDMLNGDIAFDVYIDGEKKTTYTDHYGLYPQNELFLAFLNPEHKDFAVYARSLDLGVENNIKYAEYSCSGGQAVLKSEPNYADLLRIIP